MKITLPHLLGAHEISTHNPTNPLPPGTTSALGGLLKVRTQNGPTPPRPPVPALLPLSFTTETNPLAGDIFAGVTGAAPPAAAMGSHQPPAPLFVNPALSSVQSGASKQYTLNGVPVFDAYRKLPRGPQASKAAHREIGQGQDGVVRARRNILSSVYVKHMHDACNIEDIRVRNVLLNDLATLLAQPGSAAMKDHFAPELLKEVGADGKAVYYVPAINGFSLEQYIEGGRQNLRSQLPLPTLLEEAEKLKTAMTWLHSQGFRHGDVHSGNIMYDLDRRKLVLIDFEGLARAQPENLNDLDRLKHTMDFIARLPVPQE